MSVVVSDESHSMTMEGVDDLEGERLSSFSTSRSARLVAGSFLSTRFRKTSLGGGGGGSTITKSSLRSPAVPRRE